MTLGRAPLIWRTTLQGTISLFRNLAVPGVP